MAETKKVIMQNGSCLFSTGSTLKRPDPTNAEERKETLRRIIRSKSRTLSEQRLDYIVNHINTKQTYFIKVLRCPVKFLNIVTSECIGTPEKKLYSVIHPLYGTFSEGYFFKSETTKTCQHGMIDQEKPAAAVKVMIDSQPDRISKTYTLAIYEPS